MVTLDINSDPQELLDQVIQSGHSRYPVLNLEKKSVEGLLLAKDLLPILRKDKQIEIKDLLREAKVVPETKKADSLLDDFKRDKSHLAVVIDEYGEICGLVTIEDILEELVGEIEDEHDIDENDLVQVSETEYIADARIEIDEFERKFGLDLNESGVETLGGLITKKLDALPKVGNIVHIGEIELVVTAADKRKIKKIGINLKN
jgi:magnesium and cobalt transporter